MKKIFLLFLVATLITVITACNRGEAPAPVENPVPTEPPAQVAEPTPTEEPAASEPATDDTGLPDLEGRTVTVAVENAYLPFNYIDLNTGEAAGWDYEAIDEICRRLNCVPEYIETRWDGMIVAVSEGQFDMAADGITITEERAEIVDFSQGYIDIEQRLLVRLDEDRFTNTEEFVADDSLLVGTQLGTTNYDTALALVGADRIQTFDEFGLAVQALISGDVDAVIIDETAGLGYQGVNADKLKLAGDSLASDKLGFIFPKGSDLVEPFNAALAQLQADGFLDELAAIYFSDQFTLTPDDIGPGAYLEDEPEEPEAEAGETIEEEPAPVEQPSGNVVGDVDPFAPTPGQSRLYMFNEFAEEVTFDINGQTIKVPTGTPSDAQPIELPPGKYTYTISIPGGAANGEIELVAGQSWAVGVRGDAAVYDPFLIYP